MDETLRVLDLLRDFHVWLRSKDGVDEHVFNSLRCMIYQQTKRI